jgi:hypothetical protein
MGNRPECFPSQPPEPIRRIIDQSAADAWKEMPDSYTHITEFGYPILDRRGEPMETSIGFLYGGPEVLVSAGQRVCLWDVWVEVVKADTVAETSEVDGRTIMFCSATVKLAD